MSAFDPGRAVATGQGLHRGALLAGVRAGVPFALAGGLLAISFGVVAQDAGLSRFAAVLMSAIVYAGSAQFTAVAIVGAGGAVGPAVVAAALMNSRFLAMGFGVGPSLPGRAPWRALQGQTVVDASFGIAARGDGTFDRALLLGSSGIQYVAWVAGTAVGVLAGGILGDPDRLGLDAVYPAFFLGLLLGELRSPHARGVAAAGAVVALALVPVAPAGVPILIAGLTALVGLTQRARAELAGTLERAS